MCIYTVDIRNYLVQTNLKREILPKYLHSWKISEQDISFSDITGIGNVSHI